MRLCAILFLLAPFVATAACAPAGPGPDVSGDWVRVDDPSAWLMSFGDEGQVVLLNRTLSRTVRGSYAAEGPQRLTLTLDPPRYDLPEKLTLTVEEATEDRLDLVDRDGTTWTLVRYGPLPEELVGKWLTLPHSDERYFIDFEEPNDVLWRRRFGMKRSEDRVGTGWTRGDSLYLHIWGSPPMHYLYTFQGDTLSFERPGIGPFGRYIKEGSPHIVHGMSM